MSPERIDLNQSRQEGLPDTLQVLDRVVASDPDLSDSTMSTAIGVISRSTGLKGAVRGLVMQLGPEFSQIHSRALQLLGGSFPRQELVFEGLQSSAQEAVLRVFKNLTLPTVSAAVSEETDQSSCFRAPELLKEYKPEAWSKRNAELSRKNPRSSRVGLRSYAGRRLAGKTDSPSTKNQRHQRNRELLGA